MLNYCFEMCMNVTDLLSAYLPIGSVNQNLEPLLAAFLTPTSPLRLFTRFLTIANPSPLPFFSEALA